MDAPHPITFSKRAASFRTSPPPGARLQRPTAMPAWRARAPLPTAEGACVIILIRLSYGRAEAQADAGGRCLHAYGSRGASALCGATDWCELVPPEETTCPACRVHLGGKAMVRVH